jgi:hypothetical protein
MHIVQADRMNVIFNFLRERIRQPREAAHAHPHREILPLNVARRNVIRIGISSATKCLGPINFGRAIAASGMRYFAIELDELGIIDIGTKPGFDRFQICAMPIARDLNAVCEAPGKIADKFDCGRAAAIAYTPRRNQLRIGADRNPCPNVASGLGSLFCQYDVALFGVDEAPNLVELETLAGQIAESLVLIRRARFASVNQQLVDRIDRNIGDPTSSAKAATFNEKVNDLRALGERQPVHNTQYSVTRLSGQAIDQIDLEEIFSGQVTRLTNQRQTFPLNGWWEQRHDRLSGHHSQHTTDYRHAYVNPGSCSLD